VRAKLRALTPKEGIDYIRHRISHAGGSPDAAFTPAAMKAIVKAAEGYPRSINIMCDNALVSGLGYQCKPVTPKIAREVIREYKGGRTLPNLRWVGAACAGAAIASACFAVPMFWSPTGTDAAPSRISEVAHAAAFTPQDSERPVDPAATSNTVVPVANATTSAQEEVTQ